MQGDIIVSLERIAEDEAKKTKDQIQKFTHENEAKLNELLSQKSEELLKI